MRFTINLEDPLQKKLYERLLLRLTEDEITKRLAELAQHDTSEADVTKILLELCNDVYAPLPAKKSHRYRGRALASLQGMLTAVWSHRSSAPPNLLLTTAILLTPDRGPITIRAMNERQAKATWQVYEVNNGKVFDGIAVGTSVMISNLSVGKDPLTYFVDRRNKVKVVPISISGNEMERIHEWNQHLLEPPYSESPVTLMGILSSMRSLKGTRCNVCDAISHGEVCSRCGNKDVKEYEYYECILQLANGFEVRCTLNEHLAGRLEGATNLVWLSGMLDPDTLKQTLRVWSVNTGSVFDYQASLTRFLEKGEGR